ncbi:hypothetical protein A6S26_05555 [Nostoc sp. ATCC 43529]|nr:hypothetical protein A6S26_05555 [Nostoc sp. ATCC 43529]
MLGLLVLLNIASFVAFAAGLVNPKLVLRGDNRTRLKSSALYLGLFLVSGFTVGANAPKKPEPIASAPIPAPKAETKPAPTQTPEQQIKPSSTPMEVTPNPTPTQTPASIAFDPAACNTDDHLPVNGASIALYTTCQYIKTGSIKPESVSIVTWKNGDAEAAVQELESESGFEKVMWRDYTLAPESGKDVCIHYKDQSVSCLTFSNPDETGGTQVQAQDTANAPTGGKCGDFATQAEAQTALPSNPQLNRDGDGTACDSLTSGGGSRTGSRRKRRQ